MSVSKNKLDVNESPFSFWDGQAVLFNVTWEGEGTLSSPTNTLYREREDKSSTQLSGSTTVSGRIQTCKLATLTPPGDWALFCTVTDGSQVRNIRIKIFVKAKGARD